jgi:hypothetical protein
MFNRLKRTFIMWSNLKNFCNIFYNSKIWSSRTFGGSKLAILPILSVWDGEHESTGARMPFSAGAILVPRALLTRGAIWALAKVLDLARAPRRTARKKGSGYENAPAHPHSQGFSAACVAFSYPEPFFRTLRAVRRGALAKFKTGYHKNMVKEYIRH